MPIPYQPDNDLLYSVFDKYPLGVGYSQVFNNTPSTLVAGKALNLGSSGVQYADSTLLLECHGFATADIDPNTWGIMAHSSVMFFNDWYLSTEPSAQYLVQGARYYLSENGNITFTPPVSGLTQEIGLAASNRELVIEIQAVGTGLSAVSGILAQIAALEARATALETDGMMKPVYDANDNGLVDQLDEARIVLTITTDGQTAFTLPSVPLQPSLSRMTLNTLTCMYGVDYTIAGTALTWTSVVPLSTTDSLDIIYR